MPQSDLPLPARRVDTLALAALLVGAIAVGASAIFVRLSELGPISSAFYRPFLAVPVVWLWLALRPTAKITRRAASAKDFGLLFLAGVLFAGDLAFWHLSLHHTSVANATLFANSAPVVVVLADWLLFRRSIGRVFVGGLVLSLIGGVCLAGGSFALNPDNLIGDFYGIVTAVFLGSYLMAVERLRPVFSTATILLWTSIGTSAVLLPVAVLSGETMVAITAYGWAILLALAWVSHAAGQGFVVYALAHLPAGLAAVGLLTEPVAAAVLAFFILSTLR